MIAHVEFADALWERIDRSPPEARGDTSKARWVCGEGEDRLFYANQLAAELNTSLSDILQGRRACCDCEVVFNAPDDW